MGGSTSVLINLLVNLFVGISSGTTVVVAQKYGARKLEELSQAVHTSFALALVGGLVLGAIGFLAAPFALEAMVPCRCYGWRPHLHCGDLLGTIAPVFTTSVPVYCGRWATLSALYTSSWPPA